MTDEDVLFEWCTLAADEEDVYANDLLQRIVELYLIRLCYLMCRNL